MRLRRGAVTTRGPVASALGLCVTAGLAIFGMTRVRITGLLAFAPLVALVVLGLTVALLASRLWELAPEDRRPAALRHLARIVALVIANLLILDVVAWLAVIAIRGIGGLFPQWVVGILSVIAALERLVATLIHSSLGLAACLGVMLLLARGVVAIARAVGRADAASRIGVGALATLIVVESWYALTLNLAGVFPLTMTAHHGTVAAIRTTWLPAPLATLTTVTLRSPDGVMDVMLRRTDELVAERLIVGDRLIVWTRRLGPTGLGLVKQVATDFELDIPEVVAALPSAELPRKWLIGSLVQHARWDEAVAQLREYRRYYPDDHAVVGSLVIMLRQRGQAARAKALEEEFLR